MKRRDFMQTGALAASTLLIVPNTVLGRSHGYVSPCDKLNIAAVGIGGKGHVDINSVNKENIVALCDCDWVKAKRTFDEYPNAKRYRDYRKMYDEMGKSIDAVIVGTPDHTHAIITAEAITMGKHVYTEKPLTHSVYESRLLTKLAAKYGVATQMGNQGASLEAVNQICEWIWNGEIGEVRKVEAFTDRPIWKQGLNVPDNLASVPKTLDWDIFTGPAKMRPYNPVYHPFGWRGWWDYGTGALGDMACHVLHPVFKALKLGSPTKVQGSSTLLMNDCAPQAQHIQLTFPQRENMPRVAMPEVEIHWYDGGLLPSRPACVPPGKDLNVRFGGVIFHGTKDTLICGCYGLDPWLASGRVPNVPKTERRVSSIIKDSEWDGIAANVAHGEDWVRACKENPSTRVKSKSDFSESGPFNEMVVMGVLAVRLQGLKKELLWDGKNMSFTNIGDNETVKMVLKEEVINGRPSKKILTNPINAQKFAADIINHPYREGWKLPDMPL